MHACIYNKKKYLFSCANSLSTIDTNLTNSFDQFINQNILNPSKYIKLWI